MITFSNAAFVGANTVYLPGSVKTPVKPAASRAARSVLKLKERLVRNHFTSKILNASLSVNPNDL